MNNLDELRAEISNLLSTVVRKDTGSLFYEGYITLIDSFSSHSDLQIDTAFVLLESYRATTYGQLGACNNLLNTDLKDFLWGELAAIDDIGDLLSE